MSLHSRNQKLLHINSKYRRLPKTTNSARFTVSLGNEKNLSEVKGIMLKEVEIVNSFYNLEYYNNRLYYTTGGGTEDFVEVVRSQYNINQLIAALVSAWAAKGITVSITIDNLTNRLTFNFSQAVALYHYRPTGEINPMSDVLGIFTNEYVEVLNFQADGIPDLCGIKSIYLYSPQLAQNQSIDSRGFNKALLAVIPNTAGFGEVIYMEKNHGDSVIYDDSQHLNLNTITLEMRDCDDNLLVPNGHDVNITLKIFH